LDKHKCILQGKIVLAMTNIPSFSSIRQKISYAPMMAKIVYLTKNWPEVVTAYRENRPLLKVKLRKGVTLEAPESANLQMVFNEVFLQECYKIYPFQGRIIDIGANVGTFAAYAVSPNVTIDAFEPSPATAECASKAFQNHPNVKVHQKAVAGAEGRRGITVRNDWLLNSLTEGTEVEAVTLDSLGPCDLLKIDCEGGEYEILYNSTCNFKRIVAEYHNLDKDRKNGAALRDYLISSGFVIDLFTQPEHGLTGMLAGRK
jgi:FkbM family methyltransferase